MSLPACPDRPILVIQARSESKRLPRKVLAEIEGRAVLEWLIDRVRDARSIAGLVVATSTRPADDAIAELAAQRGVPVFRGSSEDVLGRFAILAAETGADPIVRVSGDSPLLDAATVDTVVDAHAASGDAITVNHLRGDWPFGLAVEVIPAAILRRLDSEVEDARGREHVTIHAYEHPASYRVQHVPAPAELAAPQLRLCVDTAEDLERVRGLCALFAPRGDFSAAELVERTAGAAELR